MKPDTNIVVASVRLDTFGNQFITAEDGEEYKIGVKRDHLHVLAQPGVPLTLKWDNFMNKDYISDVVVSGNPSPPSPVAPSPTPVPPPVAPPANKDVQIARAVALKAAVEMGGGVSPAGIIKFAKEFLPFLLGEPPKALTVEQTAPKTEDALTSPVVTKEALAGLWAVAKDAEEWSAPQKDKKQWLSAASLRLFGKGDIKEITMMELSDLIGKLGEHIEKEKKEAAEAEAAERENPF